MRKTINYLKKRLDEADFDLSSNPRQEVHGIKIVELEEAIEVLNKHHESSILETGAWTTPNADEHIYDFELAQSLVNFLKERKVKTCADFGCGDGKYTQYFNEQGIETEGYDGNPHTYGLTNGKCNVLDLSKKISLEKKFDCVMSLEVGEHIPEKFEQTFIDNLVEHSNGLIIISWAVPGQEGYGHVNCKENEYIREQFMKRGFDAEMYFENIIRLTAKNGWFRNTILIFSKKDEIVGQDK